MRKTARNTLGVVALAGALSLPAGAWAQEPPAPPPPPASPATGTAPPPETPAEEAVATVTDVLSKVVFRPAAWFDRLFGDERFVPPPAERGLGLVALGAAWSRVDGFRAPARIRVDYPFPILRERFSAVLSGGDEDEIDSDRDGSIRQTSRARLGFRDTAYLAGLGYVPLEGKKSRLQIRAGARLGSAPEGLVQARYRFQTFFGDGYGVRFAETVFYRTARGPGSTTLLDADKALGARTLVRLTLEGTHYTRERGLDWGAGLTVYQRVGAEAAASITAATEGRRGGPVSPRTVGARGSYRWPLIRNRLMIDVSAGLARAKREPGEPWILSPSAGLALELTFTEKTATTRP